MSAPRVFVCPKCQKRFNSMSALNMHMRAMLRSREHEATVIRKSQKSWFRRILKRIFGGR